MEKLSAARPANPAMPTRIRALDPGYHFVELAKGFEPLTL